MVRKSRGLKLKPLIAVYCEGASEESYFKMCRQRQHAANVLTEKLKIESLDRGGLALLRAAKAKRDSLTGRSRVDQTYVVLDRDAMTARELRQCERFATENRLTMILSSTNFDVWILMHFEPVRRAYTKLALNRRLSGPKFFGRDYAQFKGGDYADYHLDDRIKQALARAAELRNATDEPWYQRDPYTDMDRRLPEIFGTTDW